MNFYSKNDEIVLCGLDECVRLAKIEGIESEIFVKDGAKIEPKEVFLRLNGKATNLLKVVKTMKMCLKVLVLWRLIRELCLKMQGCKIKT